MACDPAELILVTTTDKYEKLLVFVSSINDTRIKVYESRIANKRLQLREAIPRVKTDITILVDDDVTWPSTILPWILAPFENSKIGSVGVCQRVRRIREGPLDIRSWNYLGDDYIERRNFEISATHNIDGGTSCMSGRTNALRSEILRDPLFLDGFCNERWGNFHLNADDDNFITRWIVNHGWSTWIQYNNECMIETTLESSPNFVRQCLRWARSNWRSNWTTLAVDRQVYRYVQN
jgi:cellulose synthase/poly-beta-1,6-N-acetylglucosamine synthase-like glycosyltransferase